MPGEREAEALALDVEREYLATVRIRGKACGGGVFRSPLGDERWREVIDSIRSSTTGDSPSRYQNRRVYDAGRRLYEALADASPELRSFLEESGTPRRLVIASNRPEIHRLPWEAMIDSRRQNLAEGDLSIVHADQNAFDTVPQVASEKLSLVFHFGPDTEESTRGAMEELTKEGAGSEQRGLSITSIDVKKASHFRKRLREGNPDIVHLEAHGDHISGTIHLTPDLDVEPRQVADLLGKRLMVLFWSCYSGMVHSWGESTGLMLHQNGTGLVLGFSTPLQYKTAGALAAQFYGSVFDPRSGGDVESVFTRARARLFREERDECVWASLTVWLRCPLDLSPAVRTGPRIPAGAWTDEPPRTSKINPKIQGAVAGKFKLLEPAHLPLPLSKRLVAGFPGAAIRLRGSTRTAAPFDDVLTELYAAQPDGDETPPESDHPADALLALLEVLSSYRPSLLLWSDISARELELFHLLEELPANVAVLLVTSERIATDGLIPGMEETLKAEETSGKRRESPERDLEQLEMLVERGRFANTLELWNKLEGHVEMWNTKDLQAYLRYQRAGYWAFIKRGKGADAEARIKSILKKAKELRTRNRISESYAFEFEWRLLRANLCQRQARRDLARALYYEARELARENENLLDLGRANQELAYLSAEVGDPVLAEQLYRESIQLLGTAHGQSRDEVWCSALGRVLRDYADLIVTEPDRSDEARRLLRRSVAIHTLDGRYDQLAAALRTRGRLAATEGEGDTAEAFLEISAAICNVTENSAAWVATMREMAALALSGGRYDQCRSILDRLVVFLKKDSKRGRETGLVAMQLARTYWRLGQLDEVVRWCEQAEQLLLDEMGQERREVRNLAESARSLVEKSPNHKQGLSD